jgi:hypothetical protein
LADWAGTEADAAGADAEGLEPPVLEECPCRAKNHTAANRPTPSSAI